MVVSQHTAEPLAALDLAVATADFVAGLNYLVGQPLMISFFVIMHQVLANGVAKHVLAEEYHSLQCFPLEAPREAFEVWIQIWRSQGKPNALDAFVFQDRAKCIA